MLVMLAIVLIGLLAYFARLKRSSNTGTKKAKQPSDTGGIADIIILTLTRAGFSETMARCWVAVSLMETWGWSSSIFRTRNNLWGMKVSTQRKNTQTNFKKVDDIWAAYASIPDSALDMVYYLQARKYPKSVVDIDQLVALMYQKEYFVGESYESYLNKVKAWL